MDTSSPFDEGAASYSISGIAQSTYYFADIIDVNGNFNWDDGEPDEGDWVFMDSCDVTINQNMVINVPDDGWAIYQR